MRRWLPAVALVLAAVALWVSPVSATARTTSGYWVKAGLPTPTVPEGGLEVAGDPTPALAPSSPIGSQLPAPVPIPSSSASLIGPAAISAVRVDGVAAGADATLSLAVAAGSVVPPPSVTTILACPLASALSAPPQGGDIAKAPGYDCTRGTPGRVAADNSSISWLLPGGLQLSPGEFDVALVPNPAGTPIAYAVTFAAPKPSSVQAASGPVPTTTPVTTPAASGSPAAAGPLPGDASSALAVIPELPAGDGGGALTGPAQPASSSAPAAVVASPRAGSGSPAASTSFLPGVRLPGDDRAHRVMAVVILLALAAGWFWVAGRQERPPRLLGALAGDAPVVAASPTVGGIGRFARPRTGRPRRL